MCILSVGWRNALWFIELHVDSVFLSFFLDQTVSVGAQEVQGRGGDLDPAGRLVQVSLAQTQRRQFQQQSEGIL